MGSRNQPLQYCCRGWLQELLLGREHQMVRLAITRLITL